MFTIHKDFSLCYGHRTWVQKLIEGYSDNMCLSCRRLHGHEGRVVVYLEAPDLNQQQMVTDFRNLSYYKKFLDDNIDHRFIIDKNDPIFNKIVDGRLRDIQYTTPEGNVVLVPALETSDREHVLPLIPMYIPGTDHLTGHLLDTSSLTVDTDKEFYEGFFIVDFCPTSENLARWAFNMIKAKMDLIGVTVTRIDWWETLKSCATYMG